MPDKDSLAVFKPYPFGWGIKDNLTATVNPVATDDASKKYSIDSGWINRTSKHKFVCMDNTTGAAVWKQTTI